ncbi:PREDICTED: uncharacterized protein LOC104826012 [Tarenaya hassleriana]|uniref:uncharacterized protein LOC104826012 n=1 Tax=Tarenaya hassleriana TaxID=28532 RepID=UPI00053C3185|nr:PREDICTED: uncharacterized protein LOC104826012 [Tarenaya hassleriana]
MSSWVCSSVTRFVPSADDSHLLSAFLVHSFPATTSTKFPLLFRTKVPLLMLPRSQSSPDWKTHEQEEDPGSPVQDLRVPDEWLLPSRAIEESEWLRGKLQKWLDDEYCPEPTNVEISRVAAESYYRSLMERETDIGVILLKMAQDLTSISYKESFHGAFSSANAAVNLIIERIGSP